MILFALTGANDNQPFLSEGDVPDCKKKVPSWSTDRGGGYLKTTGQYTPEDNHHKMALQNATVARCIAWYGHQLALEMPFLVLSPPPFLLSATADFRFLQRGSHPRLLVGPQRIFPFSKSKDHWLENFQPAGAA